MEEAMRLHKDVPFGWGLWLQDWLAGRAAATRGRKARAARPEAARLRLVRADEPPLILDGEMTLNVDGRTLALRAGDFRFVVTGRRQPATPHRPAAARPAGAPSWPIGVRGLA